MHATSFFDDMRAFYSRFSYHPVSSQNVKQEAGILSTVSPFAPKSRKQDRLSRRMASFFFRISFPSCRKQDGTTTTTDGRAPCLWANLEELPDWASLPSMTKPPSLSTNPDTQHCDAVAPSYRWAAQQAFLFIVAQPFNNPETPHWPSAQRRASHSSTWDTMHSCPIM